MQQTKITFLNPGWQYSNNYIQPKEEEKKGKKRKTRLRFQREEKVECVGLTDADGDIQPI